MPLSLLVLALSSFAIGTTEFVILGLLPNVATDLGVTIPQAGWLVSGYALGVAIGAPFMAIATVRLPRKAALMALMAIFIAGNLFCALATNYQLLMVARIVTALCHGAFFGIGSVVASSLVPENRKAQAVAMMFTGLTLANVLGVPLGTALGQAAGWRSTFFAVTLIGVLAFFGLMKFLPAGRNEAAPNLRRELGALRNVHLWGALSMTVLFSAAVFALFTYIAPLLGEVTGVSPRGVSWTLLLMGVGLTIGNLIGGRLADWRLSASLLAIFALLALVPSTLAWTGHAVVTTEITLFIWAVAAFAAVPALQINVVNFGRDAPNFVSTLNIGAFNLGNALGAWAGGLVIERGYGVGQVPLASGAIALLALAVTAIATLQRPRAPALANC